MEAKQIRRRTTLLGLVIGTALALLATGVARAQEFTEEFHQQYPLSANGSVELKNLNGWIHITGWDQNTVKIDAVKRAVSKRRLDEARISVEPSASSIYIKTQYPEYDGVCEGWGSGRGSGNGGSTPSSYSYSWSRTMTSEDDDCRESLATVDYTVMVPRNARLDKIAPVNGNVEISGVRGPVRVSAVNGHVTVTGMAGDADVSSVNGTVEAGFERLTGISKVHAVNGRVIVTVPSDSSLRVRAHSLNGAISNDFGLPESRGWPVGHDMDGKIGDGMSASLDISTVNGRVEVRHANDGKPVAHATSMLPRERTLAPY